MWLNELVNRIDLAQFYPRGKTTGANQININCVFHDDKVASLSINTRTGLYYCHACGEKGNFLTWCKHQNINLKDLARQVGIDTEQKLIDEDVVEKAHDELLKSNLGMAWLREKRGISEESVKKFKLGIYKGRLSIPIYENGELVNIRLYKRDAKKGEAKMLNFKEGFGTARLFPFDNIYNPDVFLCEGELDCILANQHGYNAVTGTTGASTWRDDWNRFFSGKEIVICYDIDPPGKQAARKISGKLKSYASSIKILNLPIDPMEIKNGDLTDYFISLGHNKKDLDDLIEKTPEWQPEESDIDHACVKVSLSDASDSKYNNRKIEFDSLISGKDLAPYIVPKKIRFMCSLGASRAMCSTCQMAIENGEMERVVDHDDKDFLLFLDNDNSQKDKVLRTMFDINKRCPLLAVSEIDSFNVERIILTPEVEYSVDISKDDSYVTRTGYFIGHNIEANRVYNFSGRTISHPKSQQATHIINEAKPALSSVDSFKLTEAKFENLKKFQCEDIGKKIGEIYHDIEQVTGIRNRQDLFTAIFTTYCSPLQFFFEEKIVAKGWIETLVLGDTRTGKTEMAKSLIEYFRTGELVQGESASFAGLMGGLQQIGSRWHLNWGRIPLNNKRLVVIDEMSGLPVWDIAKLSGLRSSGIAEITKIRSEKTWARTRLIWLSNPRGQKGDNENKMLASYSQGVRAVPELIGKQEDVSRFDIVLLVSVDEVPIENINSKMEKHEIKYSGSDFHDLIMWCWKLKPEDIILDEKRQSLIYHLAGEMSNKYSQAIPLVVPSEQRIKIARMAVAIAAMTFSTEDGKSLIVKDDHIYFAVNYLNQIYDKPICAYDEFSAIEKSKHSIEDEAKIKKILVSHPETIDQFLDIDRITYTDIQEMFDIDMRSETRKLINDLLSNRALRRKGQMYEKTPAFIRLIRKIKSNGVLHENKMQDQIEEEDKVIPPGAEEKDSWPF